MNVFPRTITPVTVPAPTVPLALVDQLWKASSWLPSIENMFLSTLYSNVQLFARPRKPSLMMFVIELVLTSELTAVLLTSTPHFTFSMMLPVIVERGPATPNALPVRPGQSVSSQPVMLNAERTRQFS